MRGADVVVVDVLARSALVCPAHLIGVVCHENDVLVVERFDRPAGGGKRIIVSTLTMLGLDEMEGRYATYPDLLDVLRRTGTDPSIGRRLFQRIAFNIAVGNNDDHARNHAAFWDGHPST
ncbi:HipA domain-containing protein [Rhodococcus qingshengii]|uniref:HipA domain-containing protein n=1 Tax=Rhodococcus qingshengii TaxID=334542 RepID=UPI00364ABDE9